MYIYMYIYIYIYYIYIYIYTYIYIYIYIFASLGQVIQDFQCFQDIILFEILEYFFKRPRIT